MDIEEYINSGILIDYCLGLLTAEEKSEVDRVSNSYPQIASELQQLQNGLECYALKKFTWKMKMLKNKIWQSINATNNVKKSNR
jgi:hypothetical protein